MELKQYKVLSKRLQNTYLEIIEEAACEVDPPSGQEDLYLCCAFYCD